MFLSDWQDSLHDEPVYLGTDLLLAASSKNLAGTMALQDQARSDRILFNCQRGLDPAYQRIRLRFMSPKRMDILFVVIASLLVIMDLGFHLGERLDINVYYYTFSTISQSLASAFAFLVAVALYRMQTIENELETALGEVIQHAVHGKDVHFLMRKNRCRSWEDMDQYIRQEHIDAIPGDDVKSLMSSNWKFFWQGRKTLEALKSELVRALQLTSVVIGSSIALIPISQILKSNRGGSHLGSLMTLFILYVLVFLACQCLWFYWDIARHLTDRKPRDIYLTAETGVYFVSGTEATLSVRKESE